MLGKKTLGTRNANASRVPCPSIVWAMVRDGGGSRLFNRICSLCGKNHSVDADAAETPPSGCHCRDLPDVIEESRWT